MTCQVDGNLVEITGCMKNHLIILKPKKDVFCKEYLCDCTSCLQFNFGDCSNKNAVDNGEDDVDFEEFDGEIDQAEQIFDFIIAPLFVSLFSGSTINRSILSKLQKKALPKKTFLIQMNTVSKVCNISKDSTSK